MKTKDELLKLELWHVQEDYWLEDEQGFKYWPVYGYPASHASTRYLIAKCPSYEAAQAIVEVFKNNVTC